MYNMHTLQLTVYLNAINYFGGVKILLYMYRDHGAILSCFVVKLARHTGALMGVAQTFRGYKFRVLWFIHEIDETTAPRNYP